MKMKLLAAATCAAMSFAATAAMAQDDGVARPNSYPFAAAKGVDSHAIDKPLEGAVNKGKMNWKTWKYGPAADIPAGAKRLWNPAMIKLKNGGQLFSDTINGHDTPENYCAAANKETNDFIWTEMQHASGTWHDVRNMWGACPHAHAVPGARIPNENEMDEQHATDMGALVLVIPTVRSVQEGQLAANWAFFPPLGHRSAGSNVAGTPAFWGSPDYAGNAYRQTIIDNLVLILMIETLDGLQDADKIAKIKGVSALFAASSDLGNFSGYRQGSPDYEREINIVHDATLKAHIGLCGPSSWFDRPDFNCFQGGPPGATRGGGGRGRGARGAAPAGGAAPAPAPAQ
jgi:2-keto-3-deoxy-L-rhamnonate aldolase RhmA